MGRTLPPVAVIRAVDRVRATLAQWHRRTAPGNVALLELATGAWTTQVLYVAAKLGIADELAGGPRHFADVAKAVGAHPDAVHEDEHRGSGAKLLKHHVGALPRKRVDVAVERGRTGGLGDGVGEAIVGDIGHAPSIRAPGSENGTGRSIREMREGYFGSFHDQMSSPRSDASAPPST